MHTDLLKALRLESSGVPIYVQLREQILRLLGAGMLFLWLDLANRWNVWRFYTTVQWTSVMSWGSWILLLAMGLLALRMLSRVPDWRGPRPVKRMWALADRLAHIVLRFDRPLAALTLLAARASLPDLEHIHIASGNCIQRGRCRDSIFLTQDAQQHASRLGPSLLQ